MADATGNAPTVPSAKALGKRKMVFREDGTPVVPVPPVPIQAPAPLPRLPPIDVPPLPTGFMGQARIAHAAPDTSQDEELAKMMQNEADDEARRLYEQRAQERRDEYDLFGDGDGNALHIGMDELNELYDQECNNTEDDNMPLRISSAARQRRANLQRQIFGDDEEEGEEFWDFNGTEWVKVRADALITQLGVQQIGVHQRGVKTEDDTVTFEEVAVPIRLESDCGIFAASSGLIPLSALELEESKLGEQATGCFRAGTPHPEVAVTPDVDVDYKSTD